MFYRNIGKPLFDLLLSLLALILVSPVFVFSIILLVIVNRGKVFFIQERTGREGKNFKVLKFKTMNDNCDAEGFLLPDNERITPLGKFIRQLSIDEIPQLFNVIIGNMSFVGPRPLIKEKHTLYNSFEFNRYQVRPGITGWAQVNGRNAISGKKKFEFDNWYVQHLSLKLDLKILLLTLVRVLRMEGINAGNQVTNKDSAESHY
jgi:lipopolysaccharide/colanic/teichoic acid biosynthesis glycosyltransferase